MKKILLLALIIVVYSIAASAQISVSISGGAIVQSTIPSKITLDGSGIYILEEYEGDSGSQVQFSIIQKQIQASYVIQDYKADRSDSVEKGTLEFHIETTDLAFYFSDPINSDGFNASIGIGAGISKITLDLDRAGTSIIKEGVTHAKENHASINIYYRMSESFSLIASQTYQNQKTVTGDSFSIGLTTFSAAISF
ncbi:MAG: hypothetical protein GY786_02760 [Proteobacteria bacterium]|nr:hypothetical protein [Pseudomonadota bacterium]